MMVGRDVEFAVQKKEATPADVVLEVENLSMISKVSGKEAVSNVSFQVRAGEIVCSAGIDGNGQSELVFGISGLENVAGGSVKLLGQDITNMPIRKRSLMGPLPPAI